MKNLLISLMLVLAGCTGSNSSSTGSEDSSSRETFIDVSKLTGDLIATPTALPSFDSTSVLKEVDQTINFTNNGATNFVFNNLKVSLPAAGFSIKVNRCTAPLAPRKSCSITVAFSNRNLFDGTYASTLEVNSDLIQMSATVTGQPDPNTTGTPQLQLVLDSPFIPLGASPIRNLTITNIGTGTAKAVALSLPDTYVIWISRCASDLKPGISCVIQVTYKDSRSTTPPPDLPIQVVATGTASTPVSAGTAAPILTCTINGQTYANGASINGFNSASVPFGSACQAVIGTCISGVIANLPPVFACAVVPAATCTANGHIYNHGDSINGFAATSVPFGNTCQAVVGMCSNGIISNLPPAFSCSPAIGATCSANGQTYNSGDAINGFSTSSVPFGSLCSTVAQVGLCTNGSISNEPSFYTCQTTAGANCSISTQTVNHGNSIQVYQTSTVAYGSTCVSEQRSCTNGNLSGSYTNLSCEILPPVQSLVSISSLSLDVAYVDTTVSPLSSIVGSGAMVSNSASGFVSGSGIASVGAGAGLSSSLALSSSGTAKAIKNIINTPIILSGAAQYLINTCSAPPLLSSTDYACTVSDINFSLSLLPSSLKSISSLSLMIDNLIQPVPVNRYKISQISNFTSGQDVFQNNTADGSVGSFVEWNNEIYFGGSVPNYAGSGASKTKLLKYNAITNVITQVSDTNHADTVSFFSQGNDAPEDLVVSGGFLYFKAVDANSTTNLYQLSPTGTITTVMTAVILSGSHEFIDFNGSIYFPGNSPSKLYKLSGGVVSQVSNINPSGSDITTHLTKFNNELYFTSLNSSGFLKLFKLSAAGVITQVSDLSPSGSDKINRVGLFDGDLVFTATAAGQDQKLFKLNAAGVITQISNIQPSNTDDIGTAGIMGELNGNLYFSGSDTSSQSAIFRYDKAQNKIIKLTPTNSFNGVNKFIAYKGEMYMNASPSFSSAIYLYKIDSNDQITKDTNDHEHPYEFNMQKPRFSINPDEEILLKEAFEAYINKNRKNL
jgi:hypothetical protein